MYDRLGESSSNVYETLNPYEPLNASISDNISFFLVPTSTPKSKQQNPTAKQPLTKYKNKTNRLVKVLVMNYRSIVDKKNEYENLIHSTKPDIVIVTASWLKPKHYDNIYFFNPDQGYTPFRNMKDIQSDCEDLWIKINLFGSKSLLIGAYHKPHEHDRHSWDEFAKSQPANLLVTSGSLETTIVRPLTANIPHTINKSWKHLMTTTLLNQSLNQL
ncbi:hypothetical protein MAR_024633, partial [Mya arenaria]